MAIANQRMTHLRVTKLAGDMTRLAEAHRDEANSLEPTGHVILRALVTRWADEVESLYYGEDAKQIADRIRQGINEQVELQLKRLYSGQEV